MERMIQNELPLQTIVLNVEDAPGTLFLISSIFSNRGISMHSIHFYNKGLDSENLNVSTLSISFNSDDSRKAIITRLLSRLDCVVECY